VSTGKRLMASCALLALSCASFAQLCYAGIVPAFSGVAIAATALGVIGTGISGIINLVDEASCSECYRMEKGVEKMQAELAATRKALLELKQ
jgi:hypothetical protein